MRPTQIASLSLKLLGIYTMLQSIPLLKDLSQVLAWRGSKIEMDSGPIQTNLLFLGILISFTLFLSVGFCLILFSNSLARIMTTENEEITETTELTAKHIQAIAFSVVGLVMIVIAIPHLVQIAANLQALKSAGSEIIKKGIAIGTWAYTIGIAVQFIIGLFLFFGGRGLSSLWYFFQKVRPMKNI